MKVGDYVRLDRCQGINKIEEYEEKKKKYKLEDVIGDEWGDETFILDENDVIKSSPNIIDLIEVGDYVNGKSICKNACDDLIFTDTGVDLEEKDIKSIVTKEQFASMEYKL